MSFYHFFFLFFFFWLGKEINGVASKIRVPAWTSSQLSTILSLSFSLSSSPFLFQQHLVFSLLGMVRSGRVRLKLFLAAAVLMVVQRQSSPAMADMAVKSKYQIECTMCSACDNPCDQVPSPPPPVPSPPPPSPPPPSSSSNCPPPPSPPSNPTPTYYYSPPPPSQPTYVYSSPPPPNGYNGGGGGGGAFYPPPYQNYPAPPPPNPIVPYFPFWYHIPPPPSAANSVYFPDPTVYTIALISLFFFCFH